MVASSAPSSFKENMLCHLQFSGHSSFSTTILFLDRTYTLLCSNSKLEATTNYLIHARSGLAREGYEETSRHSDQLKKFATIMKFQTPL